VFSYHLVRVSRNRKTGPIPVTTNHHYQHHLRSSSMTPRKMIHRSRTDWPTGVRNDDRSTGTVANSKSLATQKFRFIAANEMRRSALLSRDSAARMPA
jgi:hypothetical protein